MGNLKPIKEIKSSFYKPRRQQNLSIYLDWYCSVCKNLTIGRSMRGRRRAVIGISNLDRAGFCEDHIGRIWNELDRIIARDIRAGCFVSQIFIPGHWSGKDRDTIRRYAKLITDRLEVLWEKSGGFT